MDQWLACVLACFVVSVSGYPKRVPVDTNPEICKDMTPQHGFTANTSTPPYEIVLSNTCYKEGQKITVTVREKKGHNMEIEGMFLQARKTTSNNIKAALAMHADFMPIPGVKHVGTYKCASNSSNGYGHHGDEIEAHTTSVWWMAPAASEHNQEGIAFVATVVRKKALFWTFVQSATLTYKADCKEMYTNPVGGAAGVGATVGVLLLAQAVLRLL